MVPIDRLDAEVMLADLERLVNTESPSRDVDLLEQSAAVVAAVMTDRLGVSPRLVVGTSGPHVHWSGGGAPRVLLVGHHDTVFPTGTVAARPFAVHGGRALGPGVFDMKAGIVQAIHAVATLARRDGIEILITADEEVGSQTSRALVEQRAVACGQVLVLEPSGDGGALKIARKGTGTFEVVVHGRAAHAGLEPWNGVNAIVAASELVAHIARFGDLGKGTTVTPTLVRGGTADNVVPAEVRLIVDTRVERVEEAERLVRAFAGLQAIAATVPGATVEVLGGLNRPPMPEGSAGGLLDLARDAAVAERLDPPAAVAVGGGSDGNFTAALGVPTLDGLGAVGGGAHADHEWVDISTLVPRARLLAALIDRI